MFIYCLIYIFIFNFLYVAFRTAYVIFQNFNGPIICGESLVYGFD